MNYVRKIVNKFGGASAMSRALGHNHSTVVRAWLNAGHIHPKHHNKIIQVAFDLSIAGKRHVGLSPMDFLPVDINDPRFEGRHE